MLSNLRRKRIQRLDIDEWQYFNLKSDVWWNGAVIRCGDTSKIIDKQRYSKKKVKQSFDYDRNIAEKLETIRNYVSSMILCPSGVFWQGLNDNAILHHFWHLPFQEKKIEKAFLLGETEVTQELYQAIMGVNPSKFKGNPKNPVENVSWYKALIFCNKLSDMFGLERYYKIGDAQEITSRLGDKEIHYPIETNLTSKGFRLPTEWEWEYAAKAGTQLLYSGSDNVDEVGWYENNSKINNKRTTHPVKGKKPNAWGFYDMSGNVYEWCENTYNSDDESISAIRAFRGGAWNSNDEALLSVDRPNHPPKSCTGRSNFGFRVCRYI